MFKLGQTTELNISKFGFKHKQCNNLRRVQELLQNNTSKCMMWTFIDTGHFYSNKTESVVLKIVHTLINYMTTLPLNLEQL